MFSKLMKSLGWVRNADYAELEDKLAGSEFAHSLTRQEARNWRMMTFRLKDQLKAAMRPRVDELVKAPLQRATVTTWDSYEKPHKVYRLVLHEVSLVCTDDFLWRALSEPDMKEAIMEGWAQEFARMLPAYMKEIK